VLTYITGEQFRKVATTITLFSPIILIAPLADLIISRGGGFNLSYPTALNDLVHLIIAGPFYPGTITGVTPGMRIESAAAILLIFLYVLGKRKGILKALVSVIAFHFIIVLVSNTPLIMSLAFGTPFVRLFGPGSLLSSDTQKFGIIYLTLLSAILVLTGLAFFPRFTRAWLRSIRFLRSVNYVGTVLIGFLVGYVFAGKLTPFIFDNPWDYIAVASLCCAIFLSFCGAVIFNDISDEQADAISRKRNPLVLRKVRREHYRLLGILLYSLALLFALNTSYTAFFLVLILIVLSFSYSSPPFRIKRLPIVSTFALAFATFCSVMVGFSVFAGTKAFIAFPTKLAILFLVSLTLGFTPKDLVDVEGDRKSGTYTIPVIFGPRAGKIITYVLVCMGYLFVPLLYRSSLLLMLSLSFAVITGMQFLLKKVREQLFLGTYYVFSGCVMTFLLLNPEMLSEAPTLDMGKRSQVEHYCARKHYQQVYDHFAGDGPGSDARMMALAGISAFKVRDFVTARKFLVPALSASPYESDLYSYATNALIQMDRLAEACSVNTLALERWLNPKRFIAEKGIVEMHLGEHDDALTYLLTAYRLGYDESSVLFYLARALQGKGDLDRSEKLLRILLDRNPGDASALAEMGKLRMGEREYEEAIKLFERALSVSDRSPVLHNNIGVCYLRIGNRARAAEFFKRALYIDPHYLPAQRNLELLANSKRESPSAEPPAL
jgi:4-hydroxybenzoate polyprenyltransferase/tetratricopeptide (TPR) repeat protein